MLVGAGTELTDKLNNWQHDLAVLVGGIVRHHRNPFHLTPRTVLDAKVSELSARLPALSDRDALVALRGIAASIGDGHTYITAPARPRLPLELHWFGEDLTVTRSGAAYGELIGSRVVAIGNQPVTLLQSRLRQLIPQGENEWFVLARSVELLTEPDVLAALGLEPELRCILSGGREIVTRLVPGDEPLVAAEPTPLSMQRTAEPLWFSRLEEQNAVYVQFQSYAGLQDTAAPLFETLRERPAAKLIIDLRRNPGGNYTAGREWLIVPVQRLGLTSGQLYVLVGRSTFSASMVNAIDFRRETEAILVGEPIGARPYGYQENGWFTLPSSGLNVSVATRLYRFGSAQEACFYPDQQIESTYVDFISGKDPVLEWALNSQV